MHIEPTARARRAKSEAARWLALPALLLAGCGPTDQQIAVAILTSLAVLVPVAAALNYGLHRLWRNSRELLPPSGVEAAAACLATITLVMALNIFVLPAEDAELVLVACWIIGATYLTYFSLALGTALALSRPWAFRGLYWVPALVIAALALPMALEVDLQSDSVEAIMMVLVWSGALGFSGGALLLILLGVSIHVFVRDRRRPPTDPEAPLAF